MFLLKLYLFLGLILHKVVWELLRKKSDAAPVEPRSPVLLAIKAIKISILVAIMIQTFLPDILPISSEPLWLRITGTVIYSIGLLTAIVARYQLGDNWSNIETGQVLEKQEVVETGIYAYVRHPIYTGDLLLLLGLELALNSWLFLGVFVLAPVVMFKAIKEEQMLVKQLTDYDSYCSRTKRFLPFVI